MIAPDSSKGNRAAHQMRLAKQKCSQGASALLAQMAQFAGQARQWQEAAGEHPGLMVAFEDYLADEYHLVNANSQYFAFVAACPPCVLADYLHLKLASALGN